MIGKGKNWFYTFHIKVYLNIRVAVNFRLHKSYGSEYDIPHTKFYNKKSQAQNLF